MKENLNTELRSTKEEHSKAAVKKDALGLWSSLKIFLIELLDFRHDTDREATVAAIKADIPFKGATVWILICSIFVASIGLNANSTAVVIGAMLISPLMGPILGIGLSIAINDIDTLRKSLINLATMLVLSLFTAFLFFYIFPLNQDNSELLGRVKPDIRDVLIAFFGGLALIIARTKKGTIASVVFGVAIATSDCNPIFCLRQSYPNVFPFENYPRAGSSRLFPGLCSMASNNDGTTLYTIEKGFEHRDNALLIRFYDELYQPNAVDERCDESWSLDNLRIRVITIE